jgi:hypothetical protein
MHLIGRADFRPRGVRRLPIQCDAYNRSIARGWESKSVEAQMEESGAAMPAKKESTTTPEELQQQQKKAELMLSRSRVAQQLEASTNERYSEMLRRALAELDAQIAAMTD